MAFILSFSQVAFIVTKQKCHVVSFTYFRLQFHCVLLALFISLNNSRLSRVKKFNISLGVLAFLFPSIFLIIPLLYSRLFIFYGLNLPYRPRSLSTDWSSSFFVMRPCCYSRHQTVFTPMANLSLEKRFNGQSSTPYPLFYRPTLMIYTHILVLCVVFYKDL
jgi:hypothetical protein